MLDQAKEALEILGDKSQSDLHELAKEELKESEKRRDELDLEIHKLLIPKDPNDSKNVILEIRAGTGGEEAALFAADLLKMYLKFAERKERTLTPFLNLKAVFTEYREFLRRKVRGECILLLSPWQFCQKLRM